MASPSEISTDAVPDQTGRLSGNIIRIAHVLKDAKDVNIIGLRSAHSLAVLLSSTLGFLGKRVRLIVPGTGEMWRDVSMISRDSVLVAISFPRYARLTIEVVETAHLTPGRSRGCQHDRLAVFTARLFFGSPVDGAVQN